jgi:hypothetical protein
LSVEIEGGKIEFKTGVGGKISKLKLFLKIMKELLG